MSQQPPGPRSPLSAVFLLHIALEAPIALQGVWTPETLPFIELNNTALVILKLYATLTFASCVASLLCFSLPEFLPGKRAFAVQLILYHSIASTTLFYSPRFIPHTFGTVLEQWKVTPEIVWGSAHGLLSLGVVAWWQATLPYVTANRKTQ